MKDGWHLNVAKLRDNLTAHEIEWRKTYPDSGYSHYCSIFLGDERVETEPVKRARDIIKRFPESEGFKCRLTAWWSSGRQYDLTEKVDPHSGGYTIDMEQH